MLNGAQLNTIPTNSFSTWKRNFRHPVSRAVEASVGRRIFYGVGYILSRGLESSVGQKVFFGKEVFVYSTAEQSVARSVSVEKDGWSARPALPRDGWTKRDPLD